MSNSENENENNRATTTTSGPQAEQPSPPPASTWREYVGRARTLAKDHPTAVFVVAAGAGVLFATEFAVGALLGVGAAMLLGKKTGPELREQVRRGGEELLQKTREQGERLFHEGKRQGEQLLQQGRALWPFGGKQQGPDQPASGSQSP